MKIFSNYTLNPLKDKKLSEKQRSISTSPFFFNNITKLYLSIKVKKRDSNRSSKQFSKQNDRFLNEFQEEKSKLPENFAEDLLFLELELEKDNFNMKYLNKLLELYTVSHTCLGQQIVIDDIKDIKIEVLEKAIKELSVDCHKQILDCYKNKFIKNIESLVSLKIKKYIYNTDVFTVDDNSILPLNYFIKQLQTQMNEHK